MPAGRTHPASASCSGVTTGDGDALVAAVTGAAVRRRNMTTGVYLAGLIPSISRPVPRRSRPV